MEELYKKFFYPSEAKFYEILKEQGIKATRKQVKDFIANQAVSQIHKPITKQKKDFKTITASSPNEEIQLDLLDYQKYKTSNKNHAWILICVDVFTRKAYATGIKSKSPVDVLTGFETLRLKPQSIIHDDGKEYQGVFKKYIEDNNIVNITTPSKRHTPLGIVDRFAKTIKSTIEKHFTQNNTVNWINSLSQIVEAYNNTPQEGIEGIKPNQATTKDNFATISNLNFWKSVKNNEIEKKKRGVNIDDLVRIKTDKNLLSKGYSATYSKTVHKVVNVEGNNVILDNGKKYLKSDVIVVPKNSVSVLGNKQTEAEKKNKLKRRLQKEGI